MSFTQKEFGVQNGGSPDKSQGRVLSSDHKGPQSQCSQEIVLIQYFKDLMVFRMLVTGVCTKGTLHL